MKKARDFLTDFFAENPARTQAEFAGAAGMTAANLSDVISGHVEISYRNVPRLLKGFDSKSDRLEFLVAYLRDEVPSGFEDDIVVAARPGGIPKASAREQAFASAWRALPGSGIQTRLLRLMKALGHDKNLRELFVRMTDYIDH